MSQDYILLDPSQYYENNIATDITKYSRKEYNILGESDVSEQVNNTIKLADISNFYANQVVSLREELTTEKAFSEKLTITIIVLTTLVILILIILFIILLYVNNKAFT